MNTPAPGDARLAALKAARQRDSHDKRRRAVAAVAALESAGTPVTFAAAAAAASVSSWLVYADGVREHVQAAQRRQADHVPPASPPARAAAATPASLRTDLAIARQEIKRLRSERDKLRQRLRLQLGAEIEGPERAELITRVADLEAVNHQLVAERDTRAVDDAAAQRRVLELEDELSAVRESLRRVIRDKNRGC